MSSTQAVAHVGHRLQIQNSIIGDLPDSISVKVAAQIINTLHVKEERHFAAIIKLRFSVGKVASRIRVARGANTLGLFASMCRMRVELVRECLAFYRFMDGDEERLLRALEIGTFRRWSDVQNALAVNTSPAVHGISEFSNRLLSIVEDSATKLQRVNEQVEKAYRAGTITPSEYQDIMRQSEGVASGLLQEGRELSRNLPAITNGVAKSQVTVAFTNHHTGEIREFTIDADQANAVMERLQSVAKHG